MEFFLPFQLKTFPFKISYPAKIALIGSCFSEEIGNKMAALKLDVLQNPNGILYDPISISDSLFSYIENKAIDEEDLIELNGLWHSWKHHSVFSGISKKEVVNAIEASKEHAHHFLKQAKILIITFGTAFSYQLKNSLKNVANCHKAPPDYFIKILVPIEEMKRDLLSVISALRLFNPGLKIIFTVSPVKHIKDGLEENNRSKARLIEAAHAIAEENEEVIYFPSYEIVTDVLRDYRFFKRDLVHPNEMAVDYVFEKFSNALFDPPAKEIIKEVEKVLSAANHKPFHKESVGHRKFIITQLQNIRRLESLYPFLDLSKEKESLE